MVQTILLQISIVVPSLYWHFFGHCPSVCMCVCVCIGCVVLFLLYFFLAIFRVCRYVLLSARHHRHCYCCLFLCMLLLYSVVASDALSHYFTVTISFLCFTSTHFHTHSYSLQHYVHEANLLIRLYRFIYPPHWFLCPF